MRTYFLHIAGCLIKTPVWFSAMPSLSADLMAKLPGALGTNLTLPLQTYDIMLGARLLAVALIAGSTPSSDQLYWSWAFNLRQTTT